MDAFVCHCGHEVDNDVNSLTVTPTVEDDTATLWVNGQKVASGDASDPIELKVGDNEMTIVVTAQDGTTKTYKLIVTRKNQASAPHPSDGNETQNKHPNTDTNDKNQGKPVHVKYQTDSLNRAGGNLPITATDIYTWLATGLLLLMVAAALVVIRRRRKRA